MSAGPDFFAALQGRQQPSAGPVPQPPSANNPSPAAGVPSQAGAGLAIQLNQAFEQVNAIMDEMIRNGIPIDPNMLAPQLDMAGKNLAMLTAGQGFTQDEAAAAAQGPAGPAPAAPPQTAVPGQLPTN